MMEYKSIEINAGVNLKRDLDLEIQLYSKTGWTYIGSIDNDAMGTVILVFERGE